MTERKLINKCVNLIFIFTFLVNLQNILASTVKQIFMKYIFSSLVKEIFMMKKNNCVKKIVMKYICFPSEANIHDAKK